MKKITSWSSLLLLALFVVAFAACRHDDLASKAGADADQPTFAMDIDLEDIPILPLEERTITTTDTEDGSRDESKPQSARAFEFTVPAEGGGNYPKLSFREGDQLPVYLVLYPEDSYGTQVFYSKDKVDLTVKNNKISFKMKGLEFVGGHGLSFSGKLAFDNQNKWRLTALYAPGSSEASGANIINFTGKSPAKFLNPGEKLVLGTDINIPFVLGVRKDDGSHEPGVPVTMIPDNQKVNPKTNSNPEYNNPKNYRFEVKPTEGAGFYPLGTLFAMRFSNDMKSVTVAKEMMDEKYWNGNNGNYSETLRQYDFAITKVSIRSTSMKGRFDIGSSVAFTPNETTVSSFTLPQEGGVRLNKEGAETPWLYFWQYSAEGKENSIMEVTFNLYNEALGVNTVERVYRTYGGTFKSSNKYYKHLKLARELRLSPLATLGASFISFYPGDPQGIQWSDPWVEHSHIADGPKANIGGVYLRTEVEGKFRTPFQVKDPKNPSAYLNGRTWWVLPSTAVIRGIFPPSINGISNIRDAAPTYVPKEYSPREDEPIVVDGIKIEDYAIYATYGVWDLYPGAGTQRQSKKESLRVYYGLRYVGTQYVSAWRYIELGPWMKKASDDGSNPIESKYIIQSRSLPLSAGATWNAGTGGQPGFYAYDEAKSRDLLLNTIMKNSFWSDRVEDRYEVVNTSGQSQTVDPLNYENVRYLKPDVIERAFPLLGDWSTFGGTRRNTGTIFNFWIAPDKNSGKATHVFRVCNTEQSNLSGAQVGYGKPRAVIIPILMPRQAQ